MLYDEMKDRLIRLEEQINQVRLDIRGNKHSIYERLERIEEKLSNCVVDFSELKGKVAILAGILSIIISAIVSFLIKVLSSLT